MHHVPHIDPKGARGTQWPGQHPATRQVTPSLRCAAANKTLPMGPAFCTSMGSSPAICGSDEPALATRVKVACGRRGALGCFQRETTQARRSTHVAPWLVQLTQSAQVILPTCLPSRGCLIAQIHRAKNGMFHARAHHNGGRFPHGRGLSKSSIFNVGKESEDIGYAYERLPHDFF